MGRKETHMFYVANVITFSVFLELLWKNTLLVRYRSNRFRPPQVNQFYIRAQLFGGYTRFIPLFKVVSIYNVKPSLWQFIDVTIRFYIIYVVQWTLM